MSAPDTNVERQTRNHWPPILGIAVALILGAAIGLLIAYVADVNGPQLVTGSAAELLSHTDAV